jgi:RNA-directed DNA polymerase
MSRRLVAVALARALLAGPADPVGLEQRIRRCLMAGSPWCADLARAAARIEPERWGVLSVQGLADWVEAAPEFTAPWDGPERIAVRGWYLSHATRLADAPAPLAALERPLWPSVGALAEGLGVSPGGLWRLTRGAAWQRRASLGEQHYRAELLPKRSGGWRLLEVPHPYLRGLQRKVLDELLAHVPPHPAACAYVRGRSVVDHARTHIGQPVILQFDLQDFFATVRASRVHALFETLGYPGAVARELAALCTTATPEPVLERLRHEGGLSWVQAQRLRDAHLPQGAPTSAALANLCAQRLDRRIAGLARALGARYTRYADDIVLSGGAPLRDALPRIEARLGGFALDEGFALNHRKTRCLVGAQRQQVCNIVVNARPNVPRAEFDRLKATLHGCVLHGPASQNRDAIAHWQAHLRGRVAWVAQLNPGKAQRLRRLLDQVDWSR